MNIDFPYRIAADGRTATTDDADHVRDMIEILLFTYPGERVMRPDFGTGLLQYIHAPNSPELAATLQVTLQASLTRWLGDLIDLREAAVESIEAELRVTLIYGLPRFARAFSHLKTRKTDCNNISGLLVRVWRWPR